MPTIRTSITPVFRIIQRNKNNETYYTLEKKVLFFWISYRYKTGKQESPISYSLVPWFGYSILETVTPTSAAKIAHKLANGSDENIKHKPLKKKVIAYLNWKGYEIS